MDPWADTDINEGESKATEHILKEFEDNFAPTISEGLPDSKEYLAKLEQRLHKIKADTNVLRQLSDKRDACMRELMNGFDGVEDETLSLDIPVENSPLFRVIAPQRQALTQGELVELVRYDQLIDEEETEEGKPGRQ